MCVCLSSAVRALIVLEFHLLDYAEFISIPLRFVFFVYTDISLLIDLMFAVCFIVLQHMVLHST